MSYRRLPQNIRLPAPPTGPPPVAMARPIRYCPTCQETRQDRAYCAPNRCYCRHKKCPAYRTTPPRGKS